MKPKTMILMVVAVTCGLVASYMTSRLLADRNREADKVSILVAKKTLSQGDILKIPEDLFMEKQFVRGDEPKLAINEVDKLKGRVLKRSLREGDFITAEDLLDSSGSGIMYNLPQGHQALGIRVSAETIAGGFASLPNSRVNIISTVRRGSDRDSYAKILLENVLVLAADTQTRVVENGNAMPANVVTVALKPEDVLKVELAKTLGTISLALRKFQDNSLSTVTSVDAQTLATQTGTPTDEGVETSPPAAVPVLPKEQPKATPVVQPPVTPNVVKDNKVGPSFLTQTIINGDKQDVVQFQRDSEVRTGPPALSPTELPAPTKKDNKAPVEGN